MHVLYISIFQNVFLHKIKAKYLNKVHSYFEVYIKIAFSKI